MERFVDRAFSECTISLADGKEPPSTPKPPLVLDAAPLAPPAAVPHTEALDAAGTAAPLAPPAAFASRLSPLIAAVGGVAIVRGSQRCGTAASAGERGGETEGLAYKQPADMVVWSWL